MGAWYDHRTGDEYDWVDPTIEVTVTDNPVVHKLLDHNGQVIRQWRERSPIGFR